MCPHHQDQHSWRGWTQGALGGVGLDSATLESVIATLANYTHSFRLTTLIGLLQPPPELFDIFDDVLLLSEGFVIYHVCPQRSDKTSAPLLAHCQTACPAKSPGCSTRREG